MSGPGAALRTPISSEARGRIRMLLGALEADAKHITTALGKLPLTVRNPSCWQGKIGAERAIEKLARALPIKPEIRNASGACWRFLQPVAELPGVAEQEGGSPRAGVVVTAILAARRGGLIRAQSFGAGFTVHALGRLLDRSNFKADPAAAMLESHAALAALDPAEGRRVFELPTIELPAWSGAFLASPARCADGAPIWLSLTWVAGSQTYPQQDRHLEAWRTLLEAA
jgi:hypothetical protein